MPILIVRRRSIDVEIGSTQLGALRADGAYREDMESVTAYSARTELMIEDSTEHADRHPLPRSCLPRMPYNPARRTICAIEPEHASTAIHR